MKKLVMLVMVVVLLTGCGNTKEQDTPAQQVQTENAQKEEVTEKEEKQPERGSKEEEIPAENKLEQLKEAFEEAGFEVGENQMVAFEMVGATNGYKFTLDEELVEIYEYTEDNEFHEQAKNGSINLSGFNVPIIYNNKIAMARAEEHSQVDKVVEVFNKFE